jgi:glutamate dehydrogenase/leucine dehydrogenase
VGVFDRIGADDYEQVVFCHDRGSGLRAIVAVHSTRLGPALGGTRFYPYASETAGLEDVLRLARGMTYKAARPSSSATRPATRPRPCCGPTPATSTPWAGAT